MGGAFGGTAAVNTNIKSKAQSESGKGKKAKLLANKKMNDGIRKELRAFDNDTVEEFINYVGMTLTYYNAIRKLSERSRKDALLNIRKSIEDFLEVGFYPVMADPVPKKVPLRPVEHTTKGALGFVALLGPFVPSDSRVEDAHTATSFKFYEARDAAQRAVCEYLSELKNVLTEAVPRPAQRPSADAHGVIASIAVAYITLFNKLPRITPGSTFSNIAVLVLENMHGKAPSDVTRQIKAAAATINAAVAAHRQNQQKRN